MKLSDAIRLGAAKTPRQVYGRLFEQADGEVTATCVVGAALEGIGVNLGGLFASWDMYAMPLVLAWHRPSPLITGCPVPECAFNYEIAYIHGYISPWSVGVHLNNVHHWTREAIADWLDEVGYEREQEREELPEPVIPEGEKELVCV